MLFQLKSYNKHMTKKKHILLTTSISVLSSLVAFFALDYNLNTNYTHHTLFVNNEPITKVATEPTSIAEVKALPISEAIKYQKFDGRTLGTVTPVRNQGNAAICWAYSFAAITSTNMLYNPDIFNTPLYQADSLNISPFNIDYIVNRRTGADDPLGLTKQDTIHKDLGGNTPVYNYYVPQTFFQGHAPINRKNEADRTQTGTAVGRLMDVVTIPNNKSGPSNVTEIKKAIAQYGGVTINYLASPRDLYYNPTSNKVTHASAIVGWDDTISKTRFTSGGNKNPAKQDGAWIVKNSWGPAVLDNGYFYMSYDAMIESPTAISYQMPMADSNIYYYDGKAEVTVPVDTPTSAPVASIFPVLKANSTQDEVLKTISFSLNANPNTKVKVSVYGDVTANLKNPKDEINNPESGTLLYQKVVSLLPYEFVGNYDISHTITLDTPVRLTSGTNYSVVLELVNPNNNQFYFSYEQSDNDMTYSKVGDKWVSHFKYDFLGDHPVATIHATTVLVDKPSSDKDMSNATITPSVSSVVYSDNKIYEVSVSVSINGTVVNANNYTTSQEVEINPHNDDAGSIKIKVVGKNDYSGYKSITIPIKKAPFPTLTQDNFSVDDKGVVNISANTSFLNPLNNFNQIPLPPNWSFIDPNGNFNPDTSVIYNGQNKDCYLKTTLTAKINLNKELINMNGVDFNIVGNTSFEYTGKAINPTYQVSYSGKDLTKDVDYQVSINNNTNVGNASITITGMGFFNGSKTLNFTITKATNQITHFEIVDNKPVIDATFGSQSAIIEYFSDASCTNKLNALPTKPGKYYVKITVPATDNYEEISSVKEFSITATNESNNLPLIIGISVGAVVLISLITIVAMLIVKKKKS